LLPDNLFVDPKPEIADIRTLNTSGDISAAVATAFGGAAVLSVFTGPGATLGIPCAGISALAAAEAIEAKYTAGVFWRDLVCDGCRWDFKDQIRGELGENIRLRDSRDSYWYEYSTPGNIHFGYVGRAAGFTGLELHVGATFAQQTDPENIPEENAWHGDQPTDFQAIELGIELYRGCSRPLAENCFAAKLAQFRFKLALGRRPESPYYNPVYGTDYPVDHFNGGG
jgi:hypothetical protein